MRHFCAAFLLVAAIVWCPVHAQPAPAVIPFAETTTIDGYSAEAGVTFLGRQGNGGYTSLLQQLTSPYSFGPPGAVAQLLASTSVKNFFNVPAGPANVGRQSGVFALADLDNNGLAGFALFSNIAGPDNSVTVYQGNSGLSAFTPVNYPIGPNVNSVAFADFNGDGYPDMAVAYSGNGGTIPGGIAILLNKGNGAFGSAVTYGVPAFRFAVLDLNNDGALDIVTSGGAVLLGKGNGTFGSTTQYAVGGSGQAIAIADFNKDGVPDVVAGTTLLLGNGDGTFQVGPAPPFGAANIWAFAAGDLDGDGNMDLVYADIQNQYVLPLFGNGDGTFTSGQGYAVSQFPDSLVLADFNNDGLLDIVNGSGDARGFGPSDQSDNIDILLNNGDRTFQGATEYQPPANGGFLQEIGFLTEANAAVSKFGGAVPSVLASTANGAVTLYPGDGKGGFQSPQSFALPGGAGAIAAADFNGDGLPDAAVASGGSIAILIASASGFGPPTVVSTGGLFPATVVSADFDGDGKNDLVFMSPGAGPASSPGTLAFLKGNGNSTFGTPVTIPAGFTPISVAAADINGDGKLDLVFSDSGYTVSASAGVGGAIYVSINAGGGVFQAPVQVFSGLYPAFAIADVNGDGKLDLIASSNVPDTGDSVVNWLQGNGNGTFQAPIAIATSCASDNSILVQDFNGDGIPDIVIAHQDGTAGFLEGYGNGTFSAETPFNSTYEPTLALTADLNGDGKPDLIVLGGTMAILLNDSEPPTTIQTVPSGLQFSVDEGAAQTAPQTLSLSLGSHTIAVTTPQAGAAAGTQYVFKSWSDGGALSHSITVGATATTYTATFTTQYELTISASPAGDGTVTPASGTFYDSGTVVPVTATATSGDAFTSWTGGVASSSSSSTTVTMSGPETVTANFSGGSGHPAFFSGEDSLGAGVYYLQFPDGNLFGYYNYPASSIIYHYDMGFEAFVASTAGQIYFYDFASGHWWYTSSSLFPYLYDFTLNTFIYYFPDTKNAGHYTTNPRYFSNLTTGMIFTM